MKDTITVTIVDGLNTIPVHAYAGQVLLDILRRIGKPIHAPCGGKGTCGKCMVEIAGVGTELACQFHVTKNIQVNLPGARQFVILDKSHHGKSVENDSGIEITVERGQRTVSYRGETIIYERSKIYSTEKYGLAIDVGSTTVVVFLQDLTTYEILDVISFVNPQTAFGGDVISRITHCIEYKDGLSNLQKILITELNKTISSLCRKSHINPQHIYKTTIVGNTVMQHLLYGVDPRSIAFAPYTPAFVEEKQMAAKELDLSIHPKAVVKILPSVAGYVGADIVAGVASTDLLEREGYTLYIDIGTNGEIVLGNNNKIYCCATAAGPAFEGANITCGIGAVDGAISDYQENEFSTIGNSAPIGICGSGLIDIVAFLLDKGLINSMGYMDNNFLIAPASASAINRDIFLSPGDVREVQLAKAAIYAGITTLMLVAGIAFKEIEYLYLAGGFGNYIRVESGIRIGLLPKELGDRVIPIGNSAGTGARMALQSMAFQKEIDNVIAKSEYIELSMRQDFNEAYVAAMKFEGKL